MGFVPNLTTGVWVGGEDRAIHFPGIGRGQGASMALPMWALYMKKCYANEDLKISTKAFSKPANMKIELDCEKYQQNNVENDSTAVDDADFF